ncbi:hypothetical protein GCM10007209_23420 [Haloferax sulfurifontis]|uniref:Uncharacterized protein n=1 Tax=Haloferax sulfurifontis TaxID=255616 RepID=A0A830EB60_9EURY|nr:hypothetical protein GCM10007209_23420 [Haloferax sulfurifontis]
MLAAEDDPNCELPTDFPTTDRDERERRHSAARVEREGMRYCVEFVAVLFEDEDDDSLLADCCSSSQF